MWPGWIVNGLKNRRSNASACLYCCLIFRWGLGATTSDLGACGICKSLILATRHLATHAGLNLLVWRSTWHPREPCNVSGVPKPQLLRLALLPSVWAGHSSCLSPPSLPRGEDILTLCTLPRGDEQPLGLLCPPTFCAPKRHRRHRRWPPPGNRTRLSVPPASHVTRTLQTSTQNVTFLSQSLLIEQQTLVAQTVPTIFDG